MPGVGFEPMTPVFERAKTIHALDRAATVIRPDIIRLRSRGSWMKLVAHMVEKRNAYKVLI
jgi:hypothetical protein